MVDRRQREWKGEVLGEEFGIGPHHLVVVETTAVGNGNGSRAVDLNGHVVLEARQSEVADQSTYS
jgi:hypothetical protein